MNKGRMKKICIVAVILLICGAGLFKAGMTVGAAGNAEPGSVNDPLITKSYLDSYMSNLGISGDAQSGYNKVTLTKGKTMVGQEGTEILLYSGSANAYAKSGKLVNVTIGEAVNDGMSLGKYCEYLCPDADSGITAMSDVVVFVKGGYSTN